MNRMLLYGVMFAIAQTASAQIIDVFGYDGSSISWTNSSTQGVYTVEWASSVTGSWHENWVTLIDRPVTSAQMSAQVPMYFRVRQGFSNIQWVVVGNLHNGNDAATGYGNVNYAFRISKYEINNAQYVAFLNAVDSAATNTALNLYTSSMASDPRSGVSLLSTNPVGQKYLVKPNMTNKPVVYVSFWNALRFCNWLHNGQGSGGTETGAYDLTGVSSLGMVSRSPVARYFIPNENEWYKAAYYSGSGSTYWLYPTKSNVQPAASPASSNGNLQVFSDYAANYSRSADWNDQNGNVTTVGSGGVASESAYGVADMAGNVEEWIDTVSTSTRCYRGGCWYSSETTLRSTYRNEFSPDNKIDSLGFRIASP